nr:type II toxin-antitoxin system PemK/MazF family toxin [Exiguobacterium sp. s168]
MLKVLEWTTRKLELTIVNEQQKAAAKIAKEKRQRRIQPLLVSRGEIWNCELGTNLGSEQSETRPVLIIQNDDSNKVSPNTIVVPLTRAIHRLDKKITRAPDFVFDDAVAESIKTRLRKTEVLILPESAKESESLILPEPSIVMCQNIKEISKSRLLLKVTTIDPKMWVYIHEAIEKTLGLKE